MSEPTPIKPSTHHGLRKWTTTWRKDGKTFARRFGVVGETSKSHALAQFKAWLDERAQKARDDAQAKMVGYSVSDLCRDHYAAMRGQYIGSDGKPTASETRIRIAVESFGQLYGRRAADSITPADVHAWLRRFITEPRLCIGSMGPVEKRKEPRVQSTVNDALSRIRTMYEWGSIHRGVSSGAAGGVRLVRKVRITDPDVRKKAKPKSVPQEVVDKTCAKLDSPLADLLRFMWWTGCRPGEACRVTWAHINRAGPVWIYTPPAHKTAWRGMVKVIAIGPRAQAILLAHQSPQVALPIFRRADGRTFTTNMIEWAIKGARKADPTIPHWHVNQIRHSFATRVKLTHGAEAVQAMLGHAKLSEQEAYVDRTVAAAARVAGEVG